MKRTIWRIGALSAFGALGFLAAAPHAEEFAWKTIVNNADFVPGTGAKYHAYNQPAVNSGGTVVFRARGRVPSSGGCCGGEVVNAAAEEPNIDGVYTRDMSTMGPITTFAMRGTAVPQPSNTYYQGAPAAFTEFPSTPRIDAASPLVATRGQSQPVYTYYGPDGTQARVGTSGVYANPGGNVLTGASLLGAVTELQPDLVYGLSFPYFSVPGAPAGTRFDQFPGSPAATDATKIGFKGNFTNPNDGLGYTGVYFRDLAADAGEAPVMLIASSLNTVIPNQPAGGSVKFGATAAPSAANGWVVFTAWDAEDAPTMGGIYRAPIAPSPALQTLVAIGDPVPGETAGTAFRNFDEGLSISEDGRYIAFWGTWGAETTPRVLICPDEGNKARLAYCRSRYPDGHSVAIPVHQGIFVVDAQTRAVTPIAKTGSDGITDFVYWVYSGSPPGAGGSEGNDGSRELPRWRSSAFAALSGKPGHLYGTSIAYSPFQVAFKAARHGVDGIYLRNGAATASLETVAETMTTPGRTLDAQAPAGSLVTDVGIERDGFRHENLVIAASMIYETVEATSSWAGLYMATVPALDTTTAADVSISQSAATGSTTPASTASTGKDLILLITIANAGPGVATGIAMADTLPRGATFVWASPGCGNDSGVVSCDVGSLAPGTSTVLKVVVRPTAAGSIGNYARVGSVQLDPATWNNASSAVVDVALSPVASIVQRYRLFSPVTLEHLFTTDLHEYDALGALAGTWVQEGAAGRVLDNPGSYNGVDATPYYRLYNSESRWHHWTIDANEYYTLAQFPGWSGEGVDGYILPAAASGATRLYRLVYPHIAGLHHWTIDENEYLTLTGSYGWVGEGSPEYVIQ